MPISHEIRRIHVKAVLKPACHTTVAVKLHNRAFDIGYGVVFPIAKTN